MKVSGIRLRSFVTLTLLLLIAGVAFVTCDNFVLYDEIEAATASAEEEREENDGTGDGDPPSQPLAISPVSAAVQTDNTVNFAATGGEPPYTFSMVTGLGSIVPSTGVYTAPSSTGSATVRVADSSGAIAEATVTILDSAPPPLAITPATAAIKTNEQVGFAASGGQGGYVFSVENSFGTIDSNSGLYTAPNIQGAATIRLTDAVGDFVEATVTVVPPTELRIYPETVTLNVGDTYVFSGAGGTTPYTFTLLNNLSNASITPAGSYTAGNIAGSTDTVRLTDNAGAQVSANVYVVSGGPLSISPQNPTVEEGASLQFSAAGGNASNYSYSVLGDGSIIASTGLYTAPGGVGVDVSDVSVSDGSNSVSTFVTVVPAAPTSLVADGSAGDNDEVLLSWQDNSAVEDGYAIQYRTSSGSYGPPLTVPADSTSHMVDGLSPSVTVLYIFRVYAFTNDPLQSDYSNEAFDFANP